MAAITIILAATSTTSVSAATNVSTRNALRDCGRHQEGDEQAADCKHYVAWNCELFYSVLIPPMDSTVVLVLCIFLSEKIACYATGTVQNIKMN